MVSQIYHQFEGWIDSLSQRLHHTNQMSVNLRKTPKEKHFYSPLVLIKRLIQGFVCLFVLKGLFIADIV